MGRHLRAGLPHAAPSQAGSGLCRRRPPGSCGPARWGAGRRPARLLARMGRGCSSWATWGPYVKSETAAYSVATGAQLWAKTYLPANSGGPDDAIAVSPDGAQVYVTGYAIGQGAVTIAYAAGT